nr:protein flowering locus d [Quercus suber]
MTEGPTSASTGAPNLDGTLKEMYLVNNADEGQSAVSLLLCLPRYVRSQDGAGSQYTDLQYGLRYGTPPGRRALTATRNPRTRLGSSPACPAVMDVPAEVPEPGPSLMAAQAVPTSGQHPAVAVAESTLLAIDERPSGRTKRDQATLEAAYARDPKPDKVKRLELVKLVALGEKEVQSSRRKSRPLMPHEIAQYQLSRSSAGSCNTSSDPVEFDPSHSTDQDITPPERDHDDSPCGTQNSCDLIYDRDPNSTNHLWTFEDTAPSLVALPAPSNVTKVTAKIPETGDIHMFPVTVGPTSSQSESQYSHEQSTPIGYFANRRSEASFSAPRPLESKSDSFMNHKMASSVEYSVGHAAELPKKHPPRVHLSMSSEGKATITTKDGTSPSPSRAKQAMRPFVSSTHDLKNVDNSILAGSERKPLQRSASGRSRDSRAWEFWCDKDTRTELEGRAEKESSGSAADAIGLLRSSSGRSVLGPLANKRNPTLFRDASDTKKPRLDPSKRPPLRRASTSFGRLQSKSVHRKLARPTLKYSESAVSVYIPGNDSDKENWSPERNISAAQDKSSVLGKIDHEPFPTATVTGTRRGNEHDLVVDAELVHSTRRDRKSVSSEDDLDCVQGLLSLSQGNWRFQNTSRRPNADGILAVCFLVLAEITSPYRDVILNGVCNVYRHKLTWFSDGRVLIRMWPEHRNYHMNGIGMSRIQQDFSTAQETISKTKTDPEDMLRIAAGKSRQISVAIVGAGFAGLRAADVLLRHGIRVTIYEARDRLGGRVAQSSHLGHVVDLGPNWIHGSNNNPIMQIAEATETELHAWDENELLYGTDGKPINASEAAEYSSLLWEDGVIADAFRHSEQNHDTIDPKRSLYDFFVERVPAMFVTEPADVAKRKRETLLRMAKMWGAYVGDSVTTQSLKFFWLEECIEGENPFVAGTYSKVLDEVARSARKNATIQLKTRVVGISNSTDEITSKVTVKTESGLIRDYDEVIVTSPLGWLKRNRDIFTPALTPRLSQAIDNIGYGNLDKVYITFPTAFWNDPPSTGDTPGSDDSRLNDVTSKPTAPTTPFHPPGFIHWLAPSYAGDTNPQAWDLETMNLAALPSTSAHPTLLFYIYGACAKHIASLVASSSITTHLETLLPFFIPYITRLPNYSATNSACKPTALLATAWANDELAGYGSYSNFQTGLEHGDEDVEVMRYGMPERRVWFAGEHTSPFVALGTSTGAYWSGEKVAERIVGAYELNDDGKE